MEKNTFYNPVNGAYKNKSSLKNEQTAIIFKDSKSNSFKIKQIAGFIARRIVNHMRPDLQVKAKLGFIKFGSRVEIIVPKNFKIKIKKGMLLKVVKLKSEILTLINYHIYL